MVDAQTAILYAIVMGLGVFVLISPWTQRWKRVGWVRILFILLGVFSLTWVVVAVFEESPQLGTPRSDMAKRLLYAVRFFLSGLCVGIAGSLAIAGGFKKQAN